MSKKISELDAAVALTGAEQVPVVQDGDTVRATLDDIKAFAAQGRKEVWAFAASDLSTALTTGTNKGHMHAPYPGTIIEVLAGLNVVQDANGAGGIFTVDVNVAGASILSTKLTIDNTEDHSSTATTPAVISSGAVTKGQKITADIDQVGDGSAKGLTVYLVVEPI